MKPLPQAQLDLLRSLREAWAEEPILVIGAAALDCHLGLSWRRTHDLDLSVAVEPADAATTLAGLGWRHDPGAPQRWTTPAGGFVDILPISSERIEEGSLQWPGDSTELTLIGFRLAFADAGPLVVAPGTEVGLASLRSLAVLKMAAFLDRPWERDSDLEDLAQLLSRFLPADAEERWQGRALDLEYEDVGAYELGRQLGTRVDDPERRLILSFLDSAGDLDDPLAIAARMAARAPLRWRDPGAIRNRLAALRLGLTDGRREPGP